MNAEITKKSIIKLKKQFSVTDLANEKVMIDFDSGKYFMIKGTGNDIWDMIQSEISVQEIITKLLDKYEISETECEKSVISFLNRMKEFDFIY